MTIENWNIEEMTGYKPLTTYYMDLSIAEKFGVKAVIDTVLKARKNDHDYKNLTELCMVLNWKIWRHYQSNRPLAEAYNDLWQDLDNYLCENLKGEELKYFYRTTD